MKSRGYRQERELLTLESRSNDYERQPKRGESVNRPLWRELVLLPLMR